MDSNFYKALNLIRKKSEITFEQGFAFEKLCKVYFENDDIQKQEYEKIWHYRDWAKDNPTFSKTNFATSLAESKSSTLAATTLTPTFERVSNCS